MNKLLSVSSKKVKIMRILTIVIILAMCLSTVAFAETVGESGTSYSTSSAIQDGIAKGTGSIYNVLLAVIVPIAAIMFVWNAFKALFGGERGMEQAKKNMMLVMIVLGLVYFGPMIVSQASSWFSQSGNASANIFKIS